MKKILSNGKVIVSFISVFAILSVSFLSMFTGVSFMAAAEGETGSEVVTYPVGGKYEASYKEVKTPGIEYLTVDFDKKTKVDLFTGFAKQKQVKKGQVVTLVIGTSACNVLS